MNQEWTALAAEMLRSASEEFSNHSCNDWEWPAGWTPEQREEFASAMNAWDADQDGRASWSVDRPPHDYAVMEFLADQMTDEVSA